jgi:hypothetical protein
MGDFPNLRRIEHCPHLAAQCLGAADSRVFGQSGKALSSYPNEIRAEPKDAPEASFGRCIGQALRANSTVCW